MEKSYDDELQEYTHDLLKGARIGLKEMLASLAYEDSNKDYNRKGDEGYRIAKLFQTTLGSVSAREETKLSREKFAAKADLS